MVSPFLYNGPDDRRHPAAVRSRQRVLGRRPGPRPDRDACPPSGPGRRHRHRGHRLSRAVRRFGDPPPAPRPASRICTSPASCTPWARPSSGARRPKPRRRRLDAVRARSPRRRTPAAAIGLPPTRPAGVDRACRRRSARRRTSSRRPGPRLARDAAFEIDRPDHRPDPHRPRRPAPATPCAPTRSSGAGPPPASTSAAAGRTRRPTRSSTAAASSTPPSTSTASRPIQVFARVIEEPEIRINSIDHGSRLTVRTFDDLLDYRSATSQFGLAKAALALSGFSPHTAPWPAAARRSLAAMLKLFGGGIELNTLAAIPSGSGLGTSSIMGAVLVAVIRRMIGDRPSERELFHAVLKLEQELTTGGGWQDQIGGVLPGVKVITSGPGLVPDPWIHYVMPDLLDPRPERRRRPCSTTPASAAWPRTSCATSSATISTATPRPWTPCGRCTPTRPRCARPWPPRTTRAFGAPHRHRLAAEQAHRPRFDDARDRGHPGPHPAAHPRGQAAGRGRRRIPADRRQDAQGRPGRAAAPDRPIRPMPGPASSTTRSAAAG